MKTNIPGREVQFTVLDDCLTCTVSGADGRSYTHRCARQTFETVAHAVDETPAQGEGASFQAIARRENLPFTQVNVALEFLKERGIVVVRGRRSYPSSICAFEDAMAEFMFLAEGKTQD